MKSTAPQDAGAAKEKAFDDREFPMSEADFRFIQQIAKERTGIELGSHKREMIYSRIVRRIRALRLADFGSYCRYLEENPDAELTNFINAITTNLTAFFREKHHFDYLADVVLPEIKKRNQASKRIRIWSAGCSTGEEPYSLAITLHKFLGRENWDAKILATDLDTNVVAHGRKGVYTKDRVEGLPESLINEHFQPVMQGHAQAYEVRQHLKDYITFNHLNLLGPWPMKSAFDIIFCRNVVIYFSKDTQRTLFDRYANSLVDHGFMFIGHSESLHGVSKRFDPLGKTMYRKTH
jgi:chemotaxis protein methyltransferase CheR